MTSSGTQVEINMNDDACTLQVWLICRLQISNIQYGLETSLGIR